LEIIGHYFSARGVKPELPLANSIHYTHNSWVVGLAVKALRKIHIRLPWDLLARRRADVLLFPDFTAWPSLFRTPKVVAIHDLTFVDHPEYVTKRNLKFLRRYVEHDAQKAALVLTISEFSKQRLQTEFGLPAEKILAEPIPPPAPIAPKSSLTLPTNYILFLGTIEPRKNIGGLVDAYDALPEALRDKYSLMLVGGKGWESQELMNHIEDLQSRGRKIITPGYVSDATRAALYKNASLMVMPSFYEGFGMPILEGFSYGVPVAVSDIAVFKEVTGKGGLYFDPNSVDSIKRTLQKILDDEKLRQSLIKEGTKKLKTYDWQTVANHIYKHVERLVR
jgi:glycosyltransferase involved in cell wall biosynthesis